MGKSEIVPFEDINEENENYEMAMNEVMERQNKRSLVSRKLPTNERNHKPLPLMSLQLNQLKCKNISKQSIQSPDVSPRVQRGLSLTKNKSHFIPSEKHKKELTWNYKDPKKDQIFLEAEIFANEFSSNSLQFCLWGTNNPEEHNFSSEEEILSKKEEDGDHMNLRNNKSLIIHFVDLKLIGECYWSFNKIFREDFHAVSFFF